MDADLSSTTGIVALAAATAAVLSLLIAVALTVQMRRLRAAQRSVLGETGEQDLIAHAADLSSSFTALQAYVTEVAKRLEGRLGIAEERLDGAIAHCGLIRYDAYNEMSGRQSTTIALLDSSKSGVVLSSIHHRDQARLYAKQVRDGKGELQLSPEEEEALRLALG